MCHGNICIHILTKTELFFYDSTWEVYGKVKKVIDLKNNKHVNETDPIDVMLYRVHLTISGFQTHNVSGDSTDCIDSCKSN